MSDPKEDFGEIHETLIEKHLEHHPDSDYQEASDATADAAYSAFTDACAARIDAVSDAAKDAALFRTSTDADRTS